MFKLNYKINDDFDINGQIYHANASFDNILRLLEMFKEPNTSNKTKIVVGIKILFGKETDLVKLPIDQQIDLLNKACERYIENQESFVERDILGNPMPVEQEEPAYSLEKDAEFIFAGFMQDYQINLFKEQGKLHWYIFQALLSGLSENTKFRQIIGIRQWEPTAGMSSEYKERMRQLQRIYSLNGYVEDDSTMGGD
jgi:hypothetical protein